MFKKVLVANRGAIACRIIRTLRRMGVGAVAIYSEADADSAHVAAADEAVCIGPAAVSGSYLAMQRIIEAALASGAQAIHPGYGFLSENAGFVEACEAAGLAFIGPTPQQMRVFGLKHTARALATQAGVPLLPGTGLLSGLDDALAQAQTIGYPVMLKSSAGGGGIGMQMCRHAEELRAAFDSVKRLAQANFSDAGVFLERFITDARHIEVQIFGDGAGGVLALGERDCSLQRRNQKVVEETPAPNLREEVRQALLETARKLARTACYRSAGTVEFVVDAATQEFFFLEVNARLQVEHGVTEAVTGVDLVEWMVRLAAGDMPPLHTLAVVPRGHAVQARLYAEDPAKNFQPSTGLLTEVYFPNDLRVDTWIERGTEVSAHYDPMLAKLIAHGDDREQALARLDQALGQTRIAGLESNLDYLRALMRFAPFLQGRHTTQSLAGFAAPSEAIDVLSPGVQTSVQDWPGRLGYWDVGVPPSGPMDGLALRLANRLLGNPEGAAALEITVAGPTLSFRSARQIAVTGAPIELLLDGASVPMGRALGVQAGQTLRVGRVTGTGCRAYLAVSGGLDVPVYLGSRSTFTLGQFGGHGGRVLRAGDVLHPGQTAGLPVMEADTAAALTPVFGAHWDIGVLVGPHAAPDFFTPEDMEMFFATDWQVHYNSSRTGVRLIGPKPAWARRDGGEAGLHPSNIHDNAYAIGAIDFTGDMPVILGPDGPSLGGFVCPATVVQAELWKLGQLSPGNTVRFKPLRQQEAAELARAQHAALTVPAAAEAERVVTVSAQSQPLDGAVLHRSPAKENGVEVVYRRAGDAYVLIEFGELQLDLTLRFLVHALMTRLQDWRDEGQLRGVIDLTPGIRSLQVHYDALQLPLPALMDQLLQAQAGLAAADDIEVPSRTVWLPLSWDDPATKLAIEKYMQSVSADAPWCPSNIEFIRRINGLPDIQAVYDIVFDASYMVLGLGDVYLGAPVATPLDPRHRLVTTKYNPARTWTPENAVGIGGAYMCVYGMEGPGGYQFVGRTVQMWNRWRVTRDFQEGKPWLLRFFDQIRFYPMGAEELLAYRKEFVAGRAALRIDEGVFRLSDYQRFLRENDASIRDFKQGQQAAFEAERERWRLAGVSEAPDAGSAAEAEAQAAAAQAFEGEVVASQVAGGVWSVLVAVGADVTAGQALLVIESMKMEITVHAHCAGRIEQLLCVEGQSVTAGQPLVLMC
ncbi:urea carboxylase [Polaromonas sp. CG_9.7]|nr:MULTISPECIES: urea carboxylase [unclassified Polaromonas]MBG6073357.1 urea carboxylase [Polaromonas sp. CG_9.7]MBG6115303.1 urea carboxylase [Polaromonas sp. CG_9.2]MDH6182993.1 urea carboxylase [Polaromonas sp. CG_23.6]